MTSTTHHVACNTDGHPMFATTDIVTGDPILVAYSEKGFWPAPKLNVEGFNERQGWTAEEVESARYASCFGWHIPIAIPARRAAEKALLAANPISAE